MSKKKIGHSKMRSAFYEAGDKIPELRIQSKNIQDEELHKIASEIEAKLEEFRKILDDKYIWD